MKISKTDSLGISDLVRLNAELSRELNLREAYLSHAFRSEVTFIQKGSIRLGICGETSAHGGIVLEAMKDNAGKWYVVGVYYWETRNQQVRSFIPRHDDKEAQDMRTVYSQAAQHINKLQGEFYSQKTLEAVCA